MVQFVIVVCNNTTRMHVNCVFIRVIDYEVQVFQERKKNQKTKKKRTQINQHLVIRCKS